MNEDTKLAIEEHAVAEYPREACGLIAVIKGKERYLPCRNIAQDPASTFVLHPMDFAKAEDLGTVMALVHSHPDAAAAMSDADRVMCAAGSIPWYIVSTGVDGYVGPIVRYEPEAYVAPLVGRQFSHGVLDCYTLIRDYYDRELQIVLPDFERQDNWWNEGQDLYMQHFADAGFSPFKGKIQKHDVVIMQVRSPVPNHAGVFIGEPDQILHHMYGRLSTRDVYGGWLQEITRVVIRHEELNA